MNSMKMPTPKPKRGRPVSPLGKSDTWLRLRIPAAELASLEKAARAARVSLSAHVRSKLRAAL